MEMTFPVSPVRASLDFLNQPGGPQFVHEVNGAFADVYVRLIQILNGRYDKGDAEPDIGSSSGGLTAPIGTSDISDLAITAAKIAASAVETAKILDSAITSLKLADLAVTEAKIAANAISETKIADDSITTPKIVANAITSAKIAADQIQAGHIVAGAVTTEKLDALAVTADKIAANAVTAVKIDAGAVTATKINVSSLSAINADLGAVTAGSIVVGTTNKIWLNESADGVLAIGGTTKASAPFSVSAAGVLTATGATISGSITVTGGNAATQSYADTVAGSAEDNANNYTDTGLSGKIDAGGAAADVNANTTTISGGKITTGSITATQIAAATITADKLNVTDLSAISANIGTITSGSIDVNSGHTRVRINSSGLLIGETSAGNANFAFNTTSTLLSSFDVSIGSTEYGTFGTIEADVGKLQAFLELTGASGSNNGHVYVEGLGSVEIQWSGASVYPTPLLVRSHNGSWNVEVDGDGKLFFGPDTEIDTNLYRSAANTLKTDDTFQAVGTGEHRIGLLGVGSDGGLEVNQHGSGDRAAYIDLHSDDTNTDYGARIIRGSGVNGALQLINVGTGTLELGVGGAIKTKVASGGLQNSAGTQLLSWTQGGAIGNPTITGSYSGSDSIDQFTLESDIAELDSKIESILGALRTHGLIAT